MRADILIVGQGLAGTLLGWALECAGISFEIVDAGHAAAATTAAAGIINPITGRRIVKSWRVEALLPLARACYAEMEAATGCKLWTDMRVRRTFSGEHEREVCETKFARGELAPFVEQVDDTGCWIERAARVDLQALISAMRARWMDAGRLRVGSAGVDPGFSQHGLVIDCRGVAGTEAPAFAFVPWEFSKGEMLELQIDGLAPDVIFNRGKWIVPVGTGVAWVGATHQPGARDICPSSDAREKLETAACELVGPRPWTVIGHRAGVRVNLRDKRPVAGRSRARPELGLVNGLGSKGALWAPMLARQWVNHLTEAVPFDDEVDVGRFAEGAVPR